MCRLIRFPVLAVMIVLIFWILEGSRSSAEPSASCDDPPQGSLLYMETVPHRGRSKPAFFPSENLKATSSPELVVADVDGRQLHRVSRIYPKRLWSTRWPNRAVVEDGDETLILINSSTGVANRLTFSGARPGEVQFSALPFRDSGGTRWRLVGSPRLDKIFLLDLATGLVVDLLSFLPEEDHLAPYTQISPDDAHVVLGNGVHSYLIATARPTEARRLGGEMKIISGGFSFDGGRVVYTQQRSDEISEVIVEHVDGSQTQSVFTSVAPVSARFVPGDDQLLLKRGSALSLLNLKTRRERRLFTLDREEQILNVVVAPSGAWLLVATTSEEGPSWIHLDVISPEPTRIQVAGLFFAAPPGLPRWMLFLPSRLVHRGKPGARYFGFDIESGAVQPLLSQREENLYFYPSEFTDDGQFALLSFHIAETPINELWLLDSASRSTRLLERGNHVTGAFSPDGCWVVASAAAEQGKSQDTVTLIALNGKEKRVVARGVGAVWLR